ncbi:MAG: universal stress protein, partial [Acidimicrobiia bacterium]
GDGFEIETTLLQGKPYRAILAHLDDTEPTLLIVGRLGVHADEGLDLGSTAENLARLAGCHVLLVARTFEPEPDGDSEAVRDRAVMWTSDALGQLDKVPAFARSFARKAIDDYAADNGYDTVTPTVMSAARERLGM